MVILCLSVGVLWGGGGGDEFKIFFFKEKGLPCYSK